MARNVSSLAAMTAVGQLQRIGIRRLGSPSSGFRYLGASGNGLRARDRRRIQALAIPPAWTQVRIAASPGARLQAVGIDRAGRWQYRYSEAQARLREERKRRRLREFLRALPTLRARVARDLRQSGLPRERVLAGMVQILLRCFLRPGSAVYARENGTFGLATLRPAHVRVRGNTVTFRFPGKGGRVQERCVVDARVAALVRALLRNPARELFGYRSADGRWVDVRRRDVNAYLREATGGRFTAKDFRTWAGSLLGACALARAGLPAPQSEREIRSRIAAAMRETADALGNTPAVCRASYVCPRILEQFRHGVFLSGALGPEALMRASFRKLEILERSVARLIA